MDEGFHRTMNNGGLRVQLLYRLLIDRYFINGSLWVQLTSEFTSFSILITKWFQNILQIKFFPKDLHNNSIFLINWIFQI